jgi:anti-anti-sigma factor
LSAVALITRGTLGEAPVIEVHGDLDVHSAPVVERALADAVAFGEGSVVIDLCAVDFIDSMGLRALISAQHRTYECHRALEVICPPGHLRRVFTLTGLSTHLALYPSRQAALAARAEPIA